MPLGEADSAVSSRKSDEDRWLAEAAQALAEAERLTGLLAQTRWHSDITLAALQAEIMVLRCEVERLRRYRAGERQRDSHSRWLEFSAWTAR